MDYEEARQYIDKAGKYGMVLGLSGIRKLLMRLGSPQDELSFVHIAGTNGKGSVGAFLHCILAAAGMKAGRYASPAVFCYEEKIQIADKGRISYISKEAVARWMEKIRAAIEEMQKEGLPHPTPFEMETAMAFLEFQAQGCQLVVLETGLGGRLDATNVITTGICQVLTAISRDHMQFLGESLAEIASEKAGIIKKGVPVVSWPQEPEAKEAVLQKTEEMGCCFREVSFPELSIEEMSLAKTYFLYKGERFETALLGENQPKNAALAIEAAWELKRQGYPISRAAIGEGLKNAQWPGRFTLISKEPPVVMDGCHNEVAAKSLAKSLNIYFSGKRLIGVVGMFRDKEYDKVLRETLPLMEKAYTLQPEGARGLEASVLAECGKQYCKEVIACESIQEAFLRAYTEAEAKKQEMAVIVYGSLSFLHEILNIMEGRRQR